LTGQLFIRRHVGLQNEGVSVFCLALATTWRDLQEDKFRIVFG
jgi:hypothetical protein